MKLKAKVAPSKVVREVQLPTSSTALEQVNDDIVLTTEEGLRLAAQAYEKWDTREKEAKKTKEAARDALMRLMTQAVRDEALANTRQVTADVAEAEEWYNGPDGWMAHFYPGWIIDKLESDGTTYDLQISEDPDVIKYEFEHNGRRFGRTAAFKGADFRVADFYDSLGEIEDDTLYDDLEKCVGVSYEPQFSFDEDKAQDVMARRPETVALFKRYMYPGMLESRMLPIGKVK